MVKSVGIIGYGHFGAFLQLLIKRFLPGVEIVIYAPDKVSSTNEFRSLSSVSKSDVIFLAVPISAYASVLKEIKPMLGSNTVIVDIATVKDYTANLVKSELPCV